MAVIFRQNNVIITLISLTLLIISCIDNEKTFVNGACKAENDPCVYTIGLLSSPNADCSVFSLPLNFSFLALLQFTTNCLKKIVGDFNIFFPMNIQSNLEVTGAVRCSGLANLVVGSNAAEEVATLSSTGEMDLSCYVVGPGNDMKLVSFASSNDISLSFQHDVQHPCFYSTVEADGDLFITAGVSANCPYLKKLHGQSVEISVGSFGTPGSYEALIEASGGPISINFDGKLYVDGINSIGGGVHLNCSAAVAQETSVDIKGSIQTAVQGLSDAIVELEGKFKSTVVTIKQNIMSAKDVILSNLEKLDIGGKIETVKGDLNITNVSEVSITGSVVVNGDLVITWDATVSCDEIVINGDLTVNGDIIFFSKSSGFMTSYCPITVRVEGDFEHTGTIERTGQAQMTVKGSTVPIENKTPGEQGALIAIIVCCIAVFALIIFAIFRFKKNQQVPHQQLR